MTPKPAARCFKFSIALLVLCLWLGADAIRGDGGCVIYLVRHAEKASGDHDPALSETGQKRALDLATLLHDAGIETIYSTDFARTLQTAAPLAEQLGLAVRIYDWAQMGKLAAHMLRNGGRYLVVGHSDTTPELVGVLGGDPGLPIDEATEYDRLYILTISTDGAVTTEMRRYGESGMP